MQSRSEELPGKPCIKLPELPISDEDIWKGDLFGRSKYAETISDMLADETEPLVLAVNGKWGCGKSFFLQRFAMQYERQQMGGFCIYLNAWESDYLSNPLLFLYSEIARAVKARQQFDCPDPLALKEAARIAEQIGWNVVRVLTKGIVDNLNSNDDNHPCSLYTRFVEVTEGAKKYLGAIAKKVREQTHNPLVICLDELDRCRPTYAIEMLERIKHLFNIPGIVFLLGIDREQLCHSIATVYGDIDKENYLHRFFDLEFVLPSPDRGVFIAEKCKEYGLNKYWKQLDARNNLPLCVEGDAYFMKLFHLLADVHHLELREIQTALKMYAVLARSQKAGFYFFPVLPVVLIVLRLRDRALYEKYALPSHRVSPASP